MGMTKLLLVGAGRAPIIDRLKQQLNNQELLLEQAIKIPTALEKIQTGAYRLVILSEGLEEKAVLEILEVIKIDKLSTLSIVFIESTTSIQSRLSYLAAGADEVLSQIVNWSEFWLRLNNLLHRERVWPRPARKLADLTHYYQEGLVEGPSEQIRLRQKESKILECLTRFQHRIVNKSDLMRYVWPNPVDYPNADTIEVYIRRLRLKLGKTGEQIKTYRGFGYRWESAAVK